MHEATRTKRLLVNCHIGAPPRTPFPILSPPELGGRGAHSANAYRVATVTPPELGGRGALTPNRDALTKRRPQELVGRTVVSSGGTNWNSPADSTNPVIITRIGYLLAFRPFLPYAQIRWSAIYTGILEKGRTLRGGMWHPTHLV